MTGGGVGEWGSGGGADEQTKPPSQKKTWCVEQSSICGLTTFRNLFIKGHVFVRFRKVPIGPFVVGGGVEKPKSQLLEECRCKCNALAHLLGAAAAEHVQLRALP